MEGEIAAAGERGSTEMLMWGGGDVDASPSGYGAGHDGGGAEIESWLKEDVIYAEKAIET